jgi:hypothetical protein
MSITSNTKPAVAVSLVSSTTWRPVGGLRFIFILPSHVLTGYSWFCHIHWAHQAENRRWPSLNVVYSLKWSELTLYCSNLHSSTCPCALRTDCVDSVCTPNRLCGVRASPCGLHVNSRCPGELRTKIALSRDWTWLSTAEPIAALMCALYHSTILSCYLLLTCAIYVACGSNRKHIYFYSTWGIWYMSWTSFSMWIQWRCPFCDQTNHIW